jgi:poly(3-hydroxybutyrate) depolymerase
MMLVPTGVFGKAQSALLKHPLNPSRYIPGSKSVAAMHDVIGDLTKRYKKPNFDLSSTVCDGEVVKITEQIVRRKPFGQIRHFQRSISRPNDPKVVIIVPMSGHFATLLKDTVKALIPDHDVYITEWRDAKKVPISEGAFGLDEYIDYLIDAFEFLGSDVNVMAICQPVVPALAAVAIMAEDGNPATPRSLTLMGGPVDARIDPTQPCKLATKNSFSSFKRNMIHRVPAPNPGAMRKVYPGFFQLSGFISMNKKRHAGAFKDLFLALRSDKTEEVERHRKFYDEYFAVMDIPSEFYLDTIKKVFQEFHLAKGCFYHRDRLVNPTAIKNTALMTIEGENDDISSPGQTASAHILCPNIQDIKRAKYLQKGAGHYGIFSGSRWRNEVAPEFKKFIRSI